MRAGLWGSKKPAEEAFIELTELIRQDVATAEATGRLTKGDHLMKSVSRYCDRYCD